MNITPSQSRLYSAALAMACSVALLVAIGQAMNPGRLALMPHVVELAPVVVTAPAPATVAAQAATQTVAN